MKVIKGDLIKLALEGKFDVIVHGCNCQNTMGKGIAKSIKETFPEAYQSDLETKKGDINKLGGFTVAKINNLHIVNAYTQYDYRATYTSEKDKIFADYNAIRKCFQNIYIAYNNKNLRIGYPKIGAGLAGGDWTIISKIIDEELKDMDHTLVELP